MSFETEPASSSESVETPIRERLAAWALSGPLAWIVGLLCVAQLVTWAPQYLTWPWWADHDVFATAALGWDAGMLPYRDLLGNNFPGTTYLFWVLGKCFGWGYTPAFWAADVGFVLTLGVVMLAWSMRRFGRALPGLIGYLTFLGYYLNLDYSQAAQRDWHGPFFAVVGLLIAQTWTGRGGRWASALMFATALIFRPQVILFAPPLMLAVGQAGRSPEGRGWGILNILEWGVVVTLGVAAGFAPLALDGLMGDFVKGVRLAAYGSTYNAVSVGSFARAMTIQALNLKVVVTAGTLLLLVGRASTPSRRLTWTWLLALACVLLYRPMSPIQHAYLTHPLMVTWAVEVAILTALVLEQGLVLPSTRLTAVLLVVGIGASAKPRFCNPVGSFEAITWLRLGEDPAPRPTGYTTNDESKSAGRYDWDDYRRLLDYLRHETKGTTCVANVLRHVPALTGPAARLPAIPAESVAWLKVVRASDDARFAEALAETPDSLVVWDPHNPEYWPIPLPPRLTEVIEREYQPSVRFGILEVWKRRQGSSRTRDRRITLVE